MLPLKKLTLKAMKLSKVIKKAKCIKTEVKRLIRNARAEHVRQNLNDNQQNPHKFWQEINPLIKYKSPSTAINLVDDNDVPISPV